MKKYLHTLILFTTITCSSLAQSFTVEGSRTIFDFPANKGTGKYSFFNLTTGKEVAPADSNSTLWDIAFSTTKIIINSGTSGPGTVAAQMLSSTSFAALTAAPATGYVQDATSKAISGWYTYNYVPADGGPHTITPMAGKIIVIQLANGNYAKIELLNYYKGAPTDVPVTGAPYSGTPQYYTFRYLVAPAGTADLSKLTTTVKNLYANGSNYQFFNFASGDTSIVADSNSTKWDIAFKATSVIMNSGISGPDQDSAQVVATDFSSVTTAPSADWKSDETATGKAIAGWYNYDMSTHILSAAADKIYLIKLSSGRYVKLIFDSYYKDGVTSNASRYYSFTYYFQPTGSIDLTAEDERETDTPVTTGIFTPAAKAVTIYPNPLSSANNTLTVATNTIGASVKIIDLLGNQVYTSTMTDATTQLTNVNLIKGFYLVVLESNGTTYQQKLLVE
jgi:hypothetical protein